MLTLDTKNREKSTHLETLRSEGQVPAVFYGPGVETTSISVPSKEFTKILEEAGESTVVTLKTEDGDKQVLIHDVEFHPVKETPLHVDFYLFDKTKTVEVAVPLLFEGVSPAVKEQGGILVKVMHELKVEALPSNLPSEISVDISRMSELDSTLLAQDIVLPEGVSLVEGAEEVVAAISEAKEEEEEVNTDISSVEVEDKGKKEEESAE